MTVTFLDVGQGDAIFIEAPNGNQLLYDAGPPSGGVLRALPRVMPWWDHSIDAVVLSHPDMDHIGGFPELLKRYDVGVAIVSGAHSENGVYDATEEAFQNEHAGHLIAHRGMSIDLGDGVIGDILYPDHDTSHMETNSASIVLRLHYGSTSVVLSGDLPQDLENYVVALDWEKLHSNILKLGHHGSRTSSSDAWLDAVAPEWAIISSGKNNTYGHPHKETLERLNQHHIPFLRTDELGSITFESDGITMWRKY